ncbi:MAG: hypothetical protein KDK44_02875, partial [Chlamydiia bacterium]|nr:hypothetical protein [Chlamydiia bacterium]
DNILKNSTYRITNSRAPFIPAINGRVFGVLVIKSGTMTHARECIRAKHPLYAIAPQTKIDALIAEGNAYLINRKEALPIHSRADYQAILDYLT